MDRTRVASFALAALMALATTAVATAEVDMAKRRNCTSGYSPCIRPGTDVDCWGGSGNGPRYTKPYTTYTVRGSDPYGLDADNDGRGCE
jgi:hypothetical protein